MQSLIITSVRLVSTFERTTIVLVLVSRLIFILVHGRYKLDNGAGMS
jgi:hypothetical protein